MIDERKYSTFHHHLDVEALEEALGFEPLKEGRNKQGEAEDIGQCPDPWNLHKNGDTTGKFAINREHGLYNCFVCGGGTLLDLTMAIRGVDDQEAEEWLYQFTKAKDESDETFLSEIEAILYAEKLVKPVLPYYNENTLLKWTENLSYLDGWLRDRGISSEIAVSARLGFQLDAARMAPIKLGKPREEPYSGPCVYLPHFWGERLVGWQQRWLDDKRPKWIPKYTNTTGFPRTETIFNYESVYLAQQPIIVCESVCTVLFLQTLGYPAVATFGGAVSEEQMRLLRLCQQGIVLAPDNDAPGRKWIGPSDDERRRGLDRIVLADYLARHMPVRVIEAVGIYDSGNDLADLLDGGLTFAKEAVAMLYTEAEYY